MRPRPALLAFFFLLLCGAAVLVKWSGEIQGGSAELALTEVEPARTAPGERESEARLPARPRRDAAEDGAGVRLQVVDARSQSPVVGVDVHWAPVRSSGLNGERAESTWYAVLAAWKERGTLAGTAGAGKRSTDGLGRIVLPRTDETLAVCARQGPLAGVLLLGPEEARGDGATLTLRYDPVLTVEVRDVEGRPAAGVPVALDALLEPRIEGRRGPTYRCKLGVTDDEGRALFTDLDGLEREGVRRLVARLDLPVADDDREAAQAELEVDAMFGAPAELLLPATGTLEVRVVDQDGEPLQDAVHVRLSETRDRTPPSLHAEQFRAADAEATVEFPWVGVRSTPVVTVLSQATGGQLRQIAPSPREPGERASVTIEYGARHPVLLGRALTEAGAPLADTEIDVRASDRSLATVNTNASGDFRIDLTYLSGRERPSRLEFVARHPATRRMAGTAEREFGEPLFDGATDLGELRFRDAPILAEGLVVDDLGAPIADASVHAFRRAEDGEWEARSDLRSKTDSRGRFEVRGPLESEELGIAVRSGALKDSRILPAASVPTGLPNLLHVPTAILPVSEGTRDLRIELERYGSLTGNLHADDQLTQGTVKVRLYALDEEGGEELIDTRIPYPWEGWSFAFDQLRPGLTRLVVELENACGPAHEIANVAVPSGGACTDARVKDIPLGSMVRRLTLTVLAPDGEPVGDGEVRIAEAVTGAEGACSTGYQEFPLRNGKARLWTLQPSLDLELHVPGYRTLHLEDVDADREVYLPRGIPLQLVLDAPHLVPSAPASLHALLVPAGGKPTIGGGHETPAFDPYGVELLHVSAPGSYHLHWWVSHRDGDTRHWTPVHKQPEPVEVREGEDGRLVHVEVPEEKVEAALTRR